MLTIHRYIPLVLIPLALAGCGSSSKTSNVKDSQPAPATTPATATSATATDSESPDGSGSSSGTSTSSSSGGSLADIVDKSKTKSFKVEYEMTTAGTSSSSKQTLTMASDGNRTAIDIAGTKMIEADGIFTICTSQGQAMCMEMESKDAGTAQGLSAVAAGFFGAADAIKANPDGATHTEDRTIAGRDASCWTYSYTALTATSSATTCLDKETGAPLYIEAGAQSGKDSSSFKTEATSVSTPTDADFAPTSKPMKVGANGQMDPNAMKDLADQAAPGGATPNLPGE